MHADFIPETNGMQRRTGVRVHLVLRVLIGATVAHVCGYAHAQRCIYDWMSGEFEFAGPGVDGRVAAMVMFDDGSGEKLHITGSFKSAAGRHLNGIARLDQDGFQPLGVGLDRSGIDLIVHDDGSGEALYVAGTFKSAGGISAPHIARWRDNTWSAVGAGTDTNISDLAVFDEGAGPVLFASGLFTMAGGHSTSYVARWNGAEWSAVGAGLDRVPWDLCVHDDGTGRALYASGDFFLGGSVRYGVVRWNGTSWNPVGISTASGYALGEYTSGSNTYLAAGMSYLNEPIRSWNGQAWSSVGACPVQTHWAVGGFDFGQGPKLCAAGISSGIGPLVQWTGSAWIAVPGAPPPSSTEVAALLQDVSGVFVGGRFVTSGAVVANNIAHVNEGSATALGTTGAEHGLNSSVYDIAEYDDGSGPAIYVGGTFTHAGALQVNYLGRWNGISWTSVGDGLNDGVFALLAADLGDGVKLYAAGSFTEAGGITANRVAKWDGHAWSAMGDGFNNWVDALVVMDDGSGPRLYGGGAFSASGTTATPGVAVWDGAQWSAVGDGLSGPRSPAVHAMCVFDDGNGPKLYATGRFEKSGTTVLNRVARWTGSAWEGLSSGLGTSFLSYGRAMISGNDGNGPALFVGGRFDSTDGPANNIAKWDGAWSQLGSGLTPSSDVSALAFFDDGTGSKLFVGGGLLKSLGDPGDSIARWNGAVWDDAQTSLSSSPYAMLSTGPTGAHQLFVGGSFNAAGGQPSAFLARWTCRYFTGDTNCDGTINTFDIHPFITALTDPSAYAGNYPQCDLRTADVNGNGTVNQFDIPPFVDLLIP